MRRLVGEEIIILASLAALTIITIAGILASVLA